MCDCGLVSLLSSQFPRLERRRLHPNLHREECAVPETQPGGSGRGDPAAATEKRHRRPVALAQTQQGRQEVQTHARRRGRAWHQCKCCVVPIWLN